MASEEAAVSIPILAVDLPPDNSIIRSYMAPLSSRKFPPIRTSLAQLPITPPNKRTTQKGNRGDICAKKASTRVVLQIRQCQILPTSNRAKPSTRLKVVSHQFKRNCLNKIWKCSIQLYLLEWCSKFWNNVLDSGMWLMFAFAPTRELYWEVWTMNHYADR